MSALSRAVSEVDALSEEDVRRAVVEGIVAERGEGDEPTLVVAEFGFGRGRVRADVVALSAASIDGIEVKSAADTLARLPRQAEWYGRVCDTCTLAADPAHLDKAAARLPDWWGLTAVDRDGARVVRPADENPALDAEGLANLLWHGELRAAVGQAGIEGGTAGIERDGLVAVLVGAAPVEVIAPIVRAHLLARDWEDRTWEGVEAPEGPIRFVKQRDLRKKLARDARRKARRSRRRRK